MKYIVLASLISAALLLTPVAVGGERNRAALRGSGVSRAVTPARGKDSSTKTITGCLLKGSASQEYLLMGSQDEQWTVRGDDTDLGSHLYRFVKITVLNAEDDGTPLSVVSIRSARPRCSTFGYLGLPFLIVSASCGKLPC